YGGGGGGFVDPNTPMVPTTKHNPLIQQKMQHGKEGRPVELVANFYKFATSDVTIFHYDVDISKERRNGDKGKGTPKPSSSSSPSDEQKPPLPTGSSSSDDVTTNLERFIKKF